MGRKEGSKRSEKGSGNGGGRGREGGGGKLCPSNATVGSPIGDPRFFRLHTDPRFQRLPKNKAKVSIDSRFAHMFTEKGFNDPSVNKRGSKSKTLNPVDPLRRYYKLDEEDDKALGLDGDARVEKPTPKKKRGKKERDNEKHRKQLGTERTLEIDVGVESEEEVVGSANCEVELRKHRGKKTRAGKKKTDARAGVEIAEFEVDSEDSEVEVEEFNEGLERQVQRARAGKGSAVEEEDSHDWEDDDDEDKSGLEETQEEDEENSTLSTSSSSSDSESDVEEFPEAEDEDEEKIPTTNDATRRLAIMNMDWEHIRAVHLLVLMRSFAPKGGRIYSVTVYPSEFGIEQIKEENEHGPKGIFRSKDEEVEDDDDEGADPEKLREYEKAKLRYYYAVVECDSASTATHLYNNCDGLEFERTSNTLDLRYIPDEMEFKRGPRDAAEQVPVDYKPVEFETRALQHSTVKLTWDDDEPVRMKALHSKFSRDELNEMDFRAYVASSSESEAGDDGTELDEDEIMEPVVEVDKKDKVRSKYLSLLTGTGESDVVRGKKAEKGNIEIKFHTGLDELSKKLLTKAKKDKADETVWEAYLRRKKEKKNARKNKNDATDFDVSNEDEDNQSDSHQDDPFFSHGDENPFDDPFFNQGDEDSGPSKTSSSRERNEETMKKDLNGSSKNEHRRKKEDAARDKKEVKKKQAELELLLLDDHMLQNGEEFPKVPSLENPQTNQKLKKKKNKGAKGKSAELQEKIAFSTNYDDPRFAPLFTSHHFAVDPTDPQFKISSHVAELQRQQSQSSKKVQENLNIGMEEEQGGDRKRKAELSSLVRSLKSKVQAKALRNV